MTFLKARQLVKRLIFTCTLLFMLQFGLKFVYFKINAHSNVTHLKFCEARFEMQRLWII